MTPVEAAVVAAVLANTPVEGAVAVAVAVVPVVPVVPVGPVVPVWVATPVHVRVRITTKEGKTEAAKPTNAHQLKQLQLLRSCHAPLRVFLCVNVCAHAEKTKNTDDLPVDAVLRPVLACEPVDIRNQYNYA